MKKTKQDQAATLRAARRTLGMTNEQLAEALGKTPWTLLAWLAPARSGKHRTMPSGSRMLLERILAEHKATKGKR